jgi:feruloyl-CoA synthase
MSEPPSLDKGEVTDKGSLNQRVILSCRAERIEALYGGDDPARVMAGR